MKRGAGILTLILVLSVPLWAETLYVCDGLEISIARRADVVINDYPSPLLQTKTFMWLSRQGAKDYYGFPLEVKKGAMTIWTPETSIEITYKVGENTTSMQGGECVFFSADLKTVIHCWDRRFINIPGENVFTTPAKEPVVWTRFDFEERPDEIISCRPVNLLTRGGE